MTIEPIKNFLKTLENPKVVPDNTWTDLIMQTHQFHAYMYKVAQQVKRREGWLYVSYKMNLSLNEMSLVISNVCIPLPQVAELFNYWSDWPTYVSSLHGFDTTLTTIMSNSLVNQIEQSGKDLCAL